MSEIIVVDYDPSWPRLFERLRSAIWIAVADIVISVEHVGGTAAIVHEQSVEKDVDSSGSVGYATAQPHGDGFRTVFTNRVF